MVNKASVHVFFQRLTDGEAFYGHLISPRHSTNNRLKYILALSMKNACFLNLKPWPKRQDTGLAHVQDPPEGLFPGKVAGKSHLFLSFSFN